MARKNNNILYYPDYTLCRSSVWVGVLSKTDVLKNVLMKPLPTEHACAPQLLDPGLAALS